MKPTLTYNQFVTEYYSKVLPNKESFIRKGQALMNFLAKVWFEEYKRISSINYYDRTDIDCYYNDSLIDNTLEHLGKVWTT